jgi:hypothetical protein
MTSARRADTEIANLVDKVNGAGRHNQWDIGALRKCLREFLDDLADEATRFPAIRSKAQWDLFATDSHRAEDCAFIVVVVSPERVTLIAGRGPWEDVRDHGDDFLSEDALDVLSETKRLFPTTGSPIELSRAELDDWLRPGTLGIAP